MDDVLKNVVPKYRIHGQVVDDDEYESDISRVLRAIGSDSTSQRKGLSCNSVEPHSFAQ